jgi:hypothetical protein
MTMIHAATAYHSHPEVTYIAFRSARICVGEFAIIRCNDRSHGSVGTQHTRARIIVIERKISK